MPAKANLTKAANINTTVREIDFVTRFNKNWDALRTIMGIMRPIRKTPGTKLVSSTASVTLQSGAVGEGEEIPYSLATVNPVAYGDITIEKYAKAVSIEAVAKYGAATAVQKTDDAFLNELQNTVLTRFYTFLKTGLLTDAESTFQMALAMARGKVLDKFQKMRRTVTEVVGFCNILDVYAYLGSAEINIQTQFGLNYVENFMGYRTLFLLSDPDIPTGTVIALPVENIDLYYIDPSDSDFAQLGLEYRVQGETNLIGFHANGNYNTAVGESFALMGMELWAEYLDGICVVTVGGSMKAIAATSAAGTTSGTKLTITSPENIPADWTLYFAAKSTSAYDTPAYGSAVPSTFTKVTFINGVADNVTATNGHKGKIIAANASGQVVAASDSINITA